MITALLLGSVAAVMWGIGSLTSAPASRLAGPWQAMLWTSVTSMATAGLLAVPTGLPSGDAGDWARVTAAGIASTAAIGLWLYAVNGGHVSLITPIVACDGAIAALIAVVAGQTLSLSAASALGAMVVGILLVARRAAAPGGPGPVHSVPTVTRPLGATVGIAIATAFFFGLVFFTAGGVKGVSPLWIVAISRVVSSVCALGLCLRQASMEVPPQAWSWIVAFGVLDAAGYTAYIIGARAELAIAAVAASQYAAVAAIGGVAALGERLSRLQTAGVILLVVAAAVIAAQGA